MHIASALIVVVTFFAASMQPTFARPVKITVVGDSNVYGKGVQRNDSFPSQLQAALRQKGVDAEVRNSGLNGDTTFGVLRRLDAAVPADTEIAIVWIGINDLLRGVAGGVTGSNRRKIDQRLRARGIKVLMIGPSLYNPLDHLEKSLTLSDMHFNKAGYHRMVERVLPQVEALVATPR